MINQLKTEIDPLTDTSSEKVGDILLGASYRPEEGDTKGGFTGVFATIANAYFQKYGAIIFAIIILVSSYLIAMISTEFWHLLILQIFMGTAAATFFGPITPTFLPSAPRLTTSATILDQSE